MLECPSLSGARLGRAARAVSRNKGLAERLPIAFVGFEKMYERECGFMRSNKEVFLGKRCSGGRVLFLVARVVVADPNGNILDISIVACSLPNNFLRAPAGVIVCL